MALILEDLSYKILGACFEVYKNKGSGFVEPVYQECLQIEFQLQGLPFVAQGPLKLFYKEFELTQTYKPDFICFDQVIVEIKAVSVLTDEHRAQVLNYLKATGHKLAFLINFGHSPKLEFERIVL
jgi:GxxExxY protein